ncbi:MAG: hypothetical protein KatS3mg015_0974 [Fimbriimonadales bacterium]|nr:MAG: hypothetical protein KatS3mg015_0974 [Fimbriimonadales bacterium]
MSVANRIRLRTFALSVCVAGTPAGAALLWDNTLEHNVETSGIAFGGKRWQTMIVAENFRLEHPSVIQEIGFESLNREDWTYDSVTVYLLMDRAGNGSAEPLLHSVLGEFEVFGFDTGRRDRGLPVWRYSVPLRAAIDPGNWFLGMHANGEGTDVFWATSDGGQGGNTPAWYSLDGGGTWARMQQGTRFDLTLELHGETVPEPSSLLVLCGAVALLAARRVTGGMRR